MGANRIVVVGASIAGGRAAETLRRSGYEGSIVLAGGEPHRPYDRPPLSKKFLRGQLPEERLYLRPLAQYERLGIELALGARATRLDPGAKVVEIGDRRVEFDQLLVATGADVRRLSCPGAALAGVHHLRTLEDARAIRADLVAAAAAPSQPRRVVVIGAGVIGCEVAASCREEGLEVAIVELAEIPLARAFGEAVGRIYADVHRERGVDLRLGVGVRELRGRERVESVVLDDGEEIPCDLVVAGIGVTPATDWLEGSGVAIDRGVLVDERCATNVPGIWAAGDVARTWDPRLGRRFCVESIDNAQNQGVAAAQNMVGKETIFAPVPFFWSDQYDLKLQSVGHVGPFDRVVLRGSVAERAFTAFHLVGAQLAFAIGVNRMQEIGTAKKLIAAGVAPAAAELEDPSFDLASLLPKKA